MKKLNAPFLFFMALLLSGCLATPGNLETDINDFEKAHTFEKLKSSVYIEFVYNPKTMQALPILLDEKQKNKDILTGNTRYKRDLVDLITQVFSRKFKAVLYDGDYSKLNEGDFILKLYENSSSEHIHGNHYAAVDTLLFDRKGSELLSAQAYETVNHWQVNNTGAYNRAYNRAFQQILIQIENYFKDTK